MRPLLRFAALALSLLALPSAQAESTRPNQESSTMNTPAATDHSRDFDFLRGHWYVRNRRLLKQLQGSTDWTRSRGTLIGVPLLEGMGNYDELRSDETGALGVSIRFYDRAQRRWADYWISNRDGLMQPAVFGSFDGASGEFFGDDRLDGRPIRIRQIWTGAGSATPRWEQAYSNDGGKTWETNWVMDFSRTPFPPTP